jgi:hypothetical protein
MAVSYRRKGATAKRWDETGPAVFFGWPHDSKVIFGVDLAVPGGGTSNVEIGVDVDSFEGLAFAMIEADPEAAVKAFGAALFWQKQSRKRRTLASGKVS